MKDKSAHTIFLTTIFAAMSYLGIIAKLIRLYRMTLSNSCSFVKVGIDLSEPFDTVRGFKQGDP